MGSCDTVIAINSVIGKAYAMDAAKADLQERLCRSDATLPIATSRGLGRRVLAICLQIILISSCQAQSAAESNKWLNNHLSETAGIGNGEFEDYAVESTEVSIAQMHTVNGHRWIQSIRYQSIKRISSNPDPNGKAFKVVLFGPSKSCAEDMYRPCSRYPNVFFFIYCDLPEKERIVKAITHLAQLNGAQLDRDDIF